MRLGVCVSFRLPSVDATCFRCAEVFLLFTVNAAGAQKFCPSSRPTSLQTEVSSLLVPNAAVARKYYHCCHQMLIRQTVKVSTVRLSQFFRSWVDSTWQLQARAVEYASVSRLPGSSRAHHHWQCSFTNQMLAQLDLMGFLSAGTAR